MKKENLTPEEELMNAVEVDTMNGIQVIDQKKEYKRLNSIIQNSMKSLETNYIKLACALHEVDCGQFYLLDGYKSTVDYAKDKYGIQKTTVYNYLALVDRFGLTVDSKPLYTSRQMIEMLPALKNGATVQDFTPDMSVRDIKAKARTFKSEKKSAKQVFKPATSEFVTALPALEISADSEITDSLMEVIKSTIETLHKEGKSISIFAV